MDAHMPRGVVIHKTNRGVMPIGCSAAPAMGTGEGAACAREESSAELGPPACPCQNGVIRELLARQRVAGRVGVLVVEKGSFQQMKD